MSEAGKNKFYTCSKEIDGVRYVAQFSGMALALRAVDESYLPGGVNLGTENLARYILDKVIVEPSGLTIDDFEDIETLNAVVNFGAEVMRGRFRKRNNQGAAKA